MWPLTPTRHPLCAFIWRWNRTEQGLIYQLAHVCELLALHPLALTSAAGQLGVTRLVGLSVQVPRRHACGNSPVPGRWGNHPRAVATARLRIVS